MEIAQECYKLYWTNLGSNILQNSSFTATDLTSLKKSKLDEQDMWYTDGEVRMNLLMTFTYGSIYIDMQESADQQELIYHSSVQTRDIV